MYGSIFLHFQRMLYIERMCKHWDARKRCIARLFGAFRMCVLEPGFSELGSKITFYRYKFSRHIGLQHEEEKSMKVKVCDALCGAGKTSAAINMMNERRGGKYIFVTQYITEAERIKKACPTKGFILPEADYDSGQTKLNGIRHLLQDGQNIATTHALFVSFTDEIKNIIQSQEYTLVLDEVVQTIQNADVTKNDFDILQKSGTVERQGELVEWIDSEYKEGKHIDEMNYARSHNLLCHDGYWFHWALPPGLFSCFDDIYVLTYMFQYQDMRYFFDANNISYELIGTRRQDGKFEFCPIGEMDRRRDLRNKVHILDHKKLNSIGTGRRTDLSVAWYKRELGINYDNEDMSGSKQVEQLRKNLNNLCKNIYKIKADDFLWTTFKLARPALSSKGYTSSFLPYSMRASNEYANRRYLAYCVNVFPNPSDVKYYQGHGITLNGDMYALSTLVQWLFRSAIRNDEEIWIYIPSVRMRNLLTQWLDNLAEGKDLEPVKYTSPRKNYYIPKKKSKKRKD